MNENSDEIKNQEIKPKEYKRNFTDEQRQKQKEHMTGKKLSEETKAKMRASALNRKKSKD